MGERVFIRWKVVILSFLISCAFGWITPWNNIVYRNSLLGGGHFPVASFALLIFATLLWNPLCSRFRLPWKLRGPEIILLWLTSGIATTVSYTGFSRTFILNILQGSLAGKPDIMSKIPEYILPRDKDLTGAVFYGLQGGQDLSIGKILELIPWTKWLLPLCWWMIFIVALLMVFFGISSLLGHQWIENEKVAMPLLSLPRIFAEEAERSTSTAMLRDPYFIGGLIVPLGLHMVNGLSVFFPTIPPIPTLWLAQQYIAPEGLLQGLCKVKLYIYPAFIGFAYLAPRNVSMSVWLFFILGGLVPGIIGLFGLRLPKIALGTTFGPGSAELEEMQMVGAYLAFGMFVLWLARHHIKYVVLGKDVAPEGDGFWIVHPRIGIVLMMVGSFAAVLWLFSAGISLGVIFCFLPVCFIVQIVAAKIICQGGVPYFNLAIAPSDGFLGFISSHVISPVSIYLGAVVQKVMFLDLRESLLPSLFHASIIGRRGLREKTVLALTGAVLAGLTFSVVSMLVIYYKYGAFSLSDIWAVETVVSVHEKAIHLIEYPEGPKNWIISFVIIGFFTMVLLIAAYRRFMWWPLHPIGYLMTYSSTTQVIWFSFFLGWFLNWIVFKYGGPKAYGVFRWFFIGMITGDMVMAVLWMVVGVFAPLTYAVFPT